MSAARAKRRPLGRGTAVFCAALDAFALQMDLQAARGHWALVRTPLSIAARITSTVVRYWSTSWVATFLGLSWVINTFKRGKLPRPR